MEKDREKEMDEQHIAAGLEGPDRLALARALVERGLWESPVPAELRVDYEDRSPAPGWLETWVPEARQGVVARFRDEPEEYLLVRPGMATLARFGFALDPRQVLDLLAGLPFTVASFESLYPEWDRREPPYIGPSFSRGHFRHGWACAFKGEGHGRLVSRRWLEAHPWKVLTGPDDTTLVQFHDIGVDAETALAQAAPGHQRMGISGTGGFLQEGYLYEHPIKGLYDAGEKVLKVVVLGRDVDSREMLDYAAAVRFQALGPGQPLAAVRFVFLEEARAEAHLRELWLHGLECWLAGAQERRLDAEYRAEPESGEAVS
jgi:hypothetical protein